MKTMKRIIPIEPDFVNEWVELKFTLFPDIDKATHYQEADQILSLPEKYCVFIHLNESNKMTGFIEVSFWESVQKIIPERAGYIEGWFVREELRRRGIGKALLKKAEQWTLARGCWKIFSDTDIENSISQQAHQSLEFKEVDRMILFRKILKKQNPCSL